MSLEAAQPTLASLVELVIQGNYLNQIFLLVSFCLRIMFMYLEHFVSICSYFRNNLMKVPVFSHVQNSLYTFSYFRNYSLKSSICFRPLHEANLTFK